MARDQNAFAKRQREMEKRRKAEQKRARRRKKKEDANRADEANDVDPSTAEGDDRPGPDEGQANPA